MNDQELKQKIDSLIKEMFDKGMNVDEVTELLTSRAIKEDFKRFKAELKEG